MTIGLIGYTGFVGSNLANQAKFDYLYNTKNIQEIDNQQFDLLVCSGVSAVKWLANQEPESDIKNIEFLKQHLKTIKTKHFVLISTIDIYDTPFEVNEDTKPNISKQDYYGKHRYQLEQWVAQNFVNYTIIRLPGLFGLNLKKNLIFDILNPLAKALNKSLWDELCNKLDVAEQASVIDAYKTDDFGNLKLQDKISTDKSRELIGIFARAGFSTLNFTDSRSSFQFYNLAHLWQDIQNAISHNYRILNLSSAPVTASELVKYINGKPFTNHTPKGKVNYNMYSKYAKDDKYIYPKENILEQIKDFVEASK